MVRSRAGIPAVLTIAGSDSGGGAGVQADLKAFARCGVHGMTAVTAITAQNTVEVRGVEPVSPGMIVAQVRAVLEDIGVDAVKVGMLGDVSTIEAACEAIDLIREARPDAPVVVDPVMVAESGARLLAPEALDALVAELLPRATVATPNIAEAREIAALAPARGAARDGSASGGAEAGLRPGDRAEQGSAAEAGQAELSRAVLACGAEAVVVTGGHSEGLTDVLRTAEGTWEIPGERHPGGSSHGSGCTHSSALAACLANGEELLEAARSAREIAGEAIACGLDSIGHGAGPVDAAGIGSRT